MRGPRSIVAGVIGAIAGWLLSEYTGSILWIPGITSLILLVIFNKTPLKPKAFVGAISVSIAQVVWFVIGSVVAKNWTQAGLDIVILTAGVIWLWLSPGIAAVLYLGIVQSISLIVNLVMLIGAEVGSATHRALTAHCAFRLIVITCLIVGYINWKKQKEKMGAVPDKGSIAGTGGQ